MKIKNLLVLLTMVCFALPAPVLAQGKHQRSSWYIGFGLGGGIDARWNVEGETVTFDDWLEGLDKDPKISLNFKVGGTLNPKTLLGFDITAVSQTGSASGIDAHIQINNYFLMLTHFPREEGFFIRVGGGLSNIMAEVDNLSEVNGFGLLGGLGYAFWLDTGPGLDFGICIGCGKKRIESQVVHSAENVMGDRLKNERHASPNKNAVHRT